MMKLIFSALIFFLFLGNSFAQENNNKIGNKIYGDFNGDGKFEYAFQVLIKKGEGNPLENGTADIYEIHFSDKKIKPIKDDFNEAVLVNEGDLNNDSSDEISIVQEPMNGSIGYVSTYSVKNEKSSNIIKVFSRFWYDDLISVDLQDLVEINNGIVYYFEYNPDVEYSITRLGKKIKYAKKIKAFELKSKISENANDALKSILGNKGGDEIGNGSGNSLGNRKAVSKSQPDYNCQEQGRVAVQITVDRNGNVISAFAGVQGTTNTSKCLLEASKVAAMNTKWEPDENAPDKQVGKIIYTFNLN
ncbi:energy transducer TonB [Flavobacterium sp.]|uniref:energy transducer TonB family protein n=1 Tax=Flavobacterium sp. TaxID=239 RepID=UPI003919A9C9